MKPFRALSFAVALAMALPFAPAMAQSTQSNSSGDPVYDVQAPPAYAMIGDLVIARPLLIAATVVGAGVFVISLPFTALGGNVGAAGKALVVDPGKAAFVRCLGCTESGYNRQN
ncbi:MULTISPECIES: multidrug transporter [Pseudomonas]|uniref:multidrug transporter n=1 Tax=Pseudomonas TaxID=286 RepID=UPI0015E3BFC0|nr:MULTISPECIES: multidrug transporter [Pseudomonas]MBA1243168.1 multidrug transporter [Pseudomonas japonica]MBA1287737.1 multidrug transporter [Pseudomonas japonica]